MLDSPVSFLDSFAAVLFFLSPIAALTVLIWPSNRFTMGWCHLVNKRRRYGFFFYLLVSISSAFFGTFLTQTRNLSTFICFGLFVMLTFFTGRRMYLGNPKKPGHFASSVRAPAIDKSVISKPQSGALPTDEAPTPQINSEESLCPPAKPESEEAPADVGEQQNVAAGKQNSRPLLRKLIIAAVCVILLMMVCGGVLWVVKHITEILAVSAILGVIAFVCSLPLWFWLLISFL